jgi:hypothetical protein
VDEVAVARWKKRVHEEPFAVALELATKAAGGGCDEVEWRALQASARAMWVSAAVHTGADADVVLDEIDAHDHEFQVRLHDDDPDTLIVRLMYADLRPLPFVLLVQGHPDDPESMRFSLPWTLEHVDDVPDELADAEFLPQDWLTTDVLFDELHPADVAFMVTAKRDEGFVLSDSERQVESMAAKMVYVDQQAQRAADEAAAELAARPHVLEVVWDDDGNVSVDVHWADED